ncbi:hypothetical protein [Piscinibacter sakaiensis]|uniref:hypothetical protein n=1 Tax=Piscinibacter sakaiensis TaxID=1547922 RepID=UPI003AAE8630
MTTSVSSPATATFCDRDRHAFNASFHDLGLVWYWDIDTFEELQAPGRDAAAMVRAYLTTAQAHLLKAYDVEFLVDRIVARMKEIRASGAARAPHATAFERPASCRGVIGF